MLFPALRGDQRILFLGKTNSGKSFVARYLLKLYRSKGWRIVIFDPKKDWQGRGKERRTYGGKKPYEKGTIDHPVLVADFHPELSVQIFQPSSWDETCDQFALDVMKTGNTIIYFDEITQLVSPHSIPMAFNVLWTQGRSINVGAWCGSQRPVNIPVIVKDQAEVWFVFRLTRKQDRETVEGHMPTEQNPDLVNKALPIRYFWYYEDTMEKPILVKPLKLKGKYLAK